MRSLLMCLRFITLCFCLLHLSVATALSFNVTQGHPRLYLEHEPGQNTAQQITNIKAAIIEDPIPLSGPEFPTSGRLQFDLRPILHTTGSFAIFDDFHHERNHIFVRHLAQGTDAPTPTSVKIQIGLQLSFGTTSTYLCETTKYLETANNTWHPIVIAWDSTTKHALLELNGAQTNCNPWKTNTATGQLYDWTPDGQIFVFKAKGQIDNIRLYEDMAGTAILAHYTFDEPDKFIISDVNDNPQAPKLRLSTQTSWVEDDNGGHALDMQNGGSASVIADNVLTEAFLDTKSHADYLKSTLLNTPSSYDTLGHESLVRNAQALALVYLVNEDQSYLDAARAMAQVLACESASAGDDISQSARAGAMGILYDWLFASFDNLSITCPGQQAQPVKTAISTSVKNILLERAEHICGTGQTIITGSQWRCSGVTPTVNYVSGHPHENNTFLTAALFAIIDENQELEPLLETEKYNFTQGFNPVREWVSIDGGHHMGFLTYGALYCFLDSIQIFETASDVPMFADWQGKLIQRFMYGLRGDLRFPASGDSVKVPGIGPASPFIVDFALWAANHLNDPHAKWFYQNWQLPFLSSARISELLYWKPDQPVTPVSALPLTAHFRNSGQILIRDNWGYLYSTLLEFKSSSFWTDNHHHLDQNAFTVFYKAPLLIDSGYYDQYASEHWNHYFTRSVAHNTLTVYDPTEIYTKGSVTYNNDGGQRFTTPLNPKTLGELTANLFDGTSEPENGTDYAYAVGNASKAYSPDKLEETNGFIRHILYLHNASPENHPIIATFDEVNVKPDKGHLEKRTLLHMVNEPLDFGQTEQGAGIHTMLGNIIQVQNGQGRMYIHPLLPTSRSVTKIGGKQGTMDYRFWARDALDPSQSVNYGLLSEPSSSHVDHGNWRVEIIAQDISLGTNFFNVMEVVDNVPTSTPASVVNLTSQSLALAALNNARLIGFSRTDKTFGSWLGDHNSMSTLIANLLPNATYTVTSLPYENGSYINIVKLVDHNCIQNSLCSTQKGVLNIPDGFSIGEGWNLSKSAEHRTSDTNFTSTDTMHVLIWSDKLSYSGLRRSRYKIVDINGAKILAGEFNNHNNQTYSIQINRQDVGNYSGPAFLEFDFRDAGNTTYQAKDIPLLFE